MHSTFEALSVDKIDELWFKFCVHQTTFHPLMSEEDLKRRLALAHIDGQDNFSDKIQSLSR